MRSLKVKVNIESCRGLGFALLYSGNPVGAASVFTESLSKFKDWSLYQGLASSLYLEKKHDESINAYKKSIDLNENWLNCYGLAVALFSTKNYEVSIRAFLKSLLYRNSWKAHMDGLSCVKLQRYERAIVSLKEVIKECNSKEIYHVMGDAFL